MPEFSHRGVGRGLAVAWYGATPVRRRHPVKALDLPPTRRSPLRRPMPRALLTTLDEYRGQSA